MFCFKKSKKIINEVEEYYSRIREFQQNILNKIGPIGSYFTYMGITMRLNGVSGESYSYTHSEIAEIIASYKNKNGDHRTIELEYDKLQYCKKLKNQYSLDN